MTWTLANSIADTGNGSGSAASHTAMQYLFDTYMPAKGWTTAAHPSGSAFKRKFSRTIATNGYNGASNVPQYFWADWFNATAPTTVTLYVDQTYTTTPGDTCTSTGKGTSMIWNSSSYIGVNNAWRFWNSDQDSNAILVTRGKKVYMYAPSVTHATLWEDPRWTAGSTYNQATHLLPMTNANQFVFSGYPMSTSNGNTLYPMIPDFGGSNITSISSTGLLGRGFSMMYGNTSYAPDTYFTRGFSIDRSDVLFVQPNGSSTQRGYFASANVAGALLLSNSNYYLLTYNQIAANYGALAFDFGTSEPDFS